MSDSFRLGSDGIYRCDAFQQFLWQEHGFGTKQGSPQADYTLKQVHSASIVNANLAHGPQEGDALITDCIRRSLGVRTADCVPILLLDTKTHAVAAVHAGWRGAADEITGNTLHELKEAFGTESEDIYAAIGPCIRACCYEVGEEVAAKFSSQFPEWGREEQARIKLDLPEANRRQLLRSGVREERIFDCCLCTVCQPEQFYSYRREPTNPGRMISAISRLG